MCTLSHSVANLSISNTEISIDIPMFCDTRDTCGEKELTDVYCFAYGFGTRTYNTVKREVAGSLIQKKTWEYRNISSCC